MAVRQSFGASRWQTFRMVEAPAALPGVLTGAKLSVALAGIAATLAEYAGSDAGLGNLMLKAIPQFETARAFAAVLILSAFSVLLFALLALAAPAQAATYTVTTTADGQDALITDLDARLAAVRAMPKKWVLPGNTASWEAGTPTKSPLALVNICSKIVPAFVLSQSGTL